MSATASRSALWFLVGLAVVSLGGCPPQLPPGGNTNNGGTDPVFVADREVTETESNNGLTEATSASLDGVTTLLIKGSIADSSDVDLYELGSLSPGDALAVNVKAADSNALNPTAVVFESDTDLSLATLVANNDDGGVTSATDPFMNVTIRHQAARWFIGVQASYGSTAAAGDYEIQVTVARGGTVPQTARQTVLIDFDGGTAQTRTGETVTIEAFDPSRIDASYAGQAATIKYVIAAVVEDSVNEFGVDILNTDDDAVPTGAHSVVYVGHVSNTAAIAGSEGLGIAFSGTDLYNQNPSDIAAVFVDNFSPTNFGLLDPLTVEELGVAIGNVASHEMGHLLGLTHSFDPSSIMNTFDAPTTLLSDQRFKRALINFTIFDTLGNMLVQDARQLLRQTTGETIYQANVEAAVGDTPLAIIAADLNGDGNDDLATADRFSDSVTLLFGDGQGSFASSSQIILSEGPTHVESGDFDGDGDLDLVASTPVNGAALVLFNDGTGGFTANPVSLSTGDRPVAAQPLDMENDGDLDIAVLNFQSNDVVFFQNGGNGDFTKLGNIAVGEAPVFAAAGDIDGDGLDDLAVMNFSSSDASILISDGTGQFTESSRVSAGSLPGVPVLVDLDNDNDLDLAIPNRLPSVITVQFASNFIVLPNQGDGTFGQGKVYYLGDTAESLATADFDGDGLLDIAAVSSGGIFYPQDKGNMAVLFNCGSGCFSQYVPHQAGDAPVSVTIAELNGDGWPDIAVVNRDTGDVSVFLNNGNGTFGFASQAN